LLLQLPLLLLLLLLTTVCILWHGAQLLLPLQWRGLLSLRLPLPLLLLLFCSVSGCAWHI
jgi:hypothetical protein